MDRDPFPDCSRWVTSDLIIFCLFSSTSTLRNEEQQGSQICSSWEVTNTLVAQWVSPTHVLHGKASRSTSIQEMFDVAVKQASPAYRYPVLGHGQVDIWKPETLDISFRADLEQGVMESRARTRMQERGECSEDTVVASNQEF